MKILITGASGFVGSNLLNALMDHSVSAIGRTRIDSIGNFYIKAINGSEDYSACVDDVEIVIHCAARAHIMKDESLDPLSEYRKVNVYGTLNLAKQAAKYGVKRFIYISSIKVNGESTVPGQPFRFNDNPSPEDPYGVSKAEAEAGLIKIGADTGMEIVIIRPPLVYGKGVKGNFSSLLKLTMKRVPLPLGCINNQRSMVYVQNLVDLIVTCIDHPKAANQIFLVSDDYDLSTSNLLRCLGKAANRSARLIKVPVVILEIFTRLFGKDAAFKRLTGSLQVDISHTKNTLKWKPRFTVEEGFKSCF